MTPSIPPLPKLGPLRPLLGGLGPFGGGFGAFGLAGGGTVTGIGATTITVESEFGSKVTVTTNSSTSYSESGKTVGRSAVAVGDQVLFGRRMSPATGAPGTSKVVGSVEIVPPHVSGKVMSINGSQVVVEQSDGLYVTVNTSASTTYDLAGQSASSAALKSGSVVSVTGTLTSDHEQIDATSIEIVLPSVSGRVSAVSGTTITISSFGGTTETLTTDSATTFRNQSGKATIAAVAKGDVVQAVGTPAGANSFAATAIYIGPAASPFGGPMGPGRVGRGFGGWNGPGAMMPAAGAMPGFGGASQAQ